MQLIYLSVHKVRKLKMSSKHIIYEWTLLQESLQYFYQGGKIFSEVAVEVDKITKGGFYSERADEFFISPNRRTKLFS